jgi:prepilin-type N-terminal cleavage/methylation domain-containing protein
LPSGLTSHFFARRTAFTLVELLVVVAIMVIMIGLAVPAMNALKGAGDITSMAYDVRAALQTARNYAITNKTYTWIGFFEEDLANTGKSPAIAGVGRLVISTVASKDGTPIYDTVVANWSGTKNQTNQLLSDTRLVQVGRLIKIDNAHIWVPPAYGGRPVAGAHQVIGFPGSAPHIPIFSFNFVGSNGSVQYVFPVSGSNNCPIGSGIIQFSPQGQAISEYSPLLELHEIGLQTSHGAQAIADAASLSVAPIGSPAYANSAAISVFGLSGQSKIYRP